ncbi:hypothetical protein BLA60_40970 [Actinophytocola xinjiangensis]|uniref:Carrier domain-containing protein n=1 Tax=Actinophytocola xinjiangensis TaxID=485602 RepID=A0A7Z1AUE8_9PSEU|nr:non-ribosomal peptide synthetase [Actinophytocola xinjiangensis]OLF04420.1 hypothetical protein BLA60_40970 [Actinophytocola xinjiangensis]
MRTFEGYRLSPVQRAVWNAGRGGVLRARVTVEGVDRQRLAYALRVVTARHEALRLRIAEHPGLRVPAQAPREEVSVFVADHDASAHQVEPLRLTLSGSTLLLTALPTALDQASLGILLGELATVYAGGRLPDDPERTQFLDVSEWLAENFADERPPAPAGPVVRAVDVAPLPGSDPGPRTVADATETEVFAAWALAVARHAEGTGTLALARYEPGRGVEGTGEVVGPLGAFVEVAVPLPLPLPLPATREDLVAAVTPDPGPGVVIHPLERPDVAAGFAMTTLPDLAGLAAFGATEVDVDPPELPGVPMLTAVRAGDRLTLSVSGPAGPRLLDTVCAILDALRAGGSPVVLGRAETERLVEFAGTRAGTPGVLVDLLDSGIAADPGAEAVVAPDGTLTFAELDAAATDLANRLVEAGAGAEDPVLVVAARSWRTVAAFVGVLRAGAVYVPVDPAEPPARRDRLAGLVGARLTVGGDGPLEVRRVADAVPGPRPVITGERAAYVMFTSGSTGTPRPVVVEHAAAANLYHGLAGTVYDRPRLRIGLNAPFTFDSSVKQLVQLAGGHTLCLLGEELRRDPPALLDHLAAHRVDVLDCTPTHLRAILDDRAGRVLPPTLLLGGEALDPALWDELAALDVRAVNLYGPTESTVDVTVAVVTAGTRPTIGRPLPGVRTWVCDERLAPVPLGVAGELCVSGAQLARGYLGDQTATAARFVTVTLPDGTRDRVYRTGDLVRHRPDGDLEFLGRTDDQVKVNGRRVEPGEIEVTLTGHPAITRAAVVHDGTALRAYAVPGRGIGLDLDRVEGLNPHETRYLHEEIFVRQAYLRGGITLPEDAVVFDVGANIGMFSLFAHAVCPTVRLHAFEPLTEACAALRANLANHGVAARVYPYGLGAAEGVEAFTYYPGYSMMSGLAGYADAAAEIGVVKRFLANERSQELLANADELLADRFRGVERTVRLRRLGDVLDETGVDRVDLLKVDVQRAEVDVLRGLADRHWPMIRQVTLEVHDAPGTATAGRVAEVVDLLEHHGFRVVAEQEEALVGTDRHTVHAVRPAAVRPAVPARPAPVGVDGETLRGWLAERLPEHLVPATVTVVAALPLTANGKLDRAALPAPATASTVAEPDGPVEAILLEVWQEVLGRQDFGVEDVFFRFGGDSIRGIRVRAAAQRRGVTFPLRHVFKYPTIRQLATEGGATLAGAEPAAPAEAFRLLHAEDRAALGPDIEDAYPISALQLGMLYHSELTSDRGTYHVVTVHGVHGRLDADALRAALDRTVAANPVLRTGFDLGHYREPLQLVHRDVRVPFTAEDLRSADERQRVRRLAEVVAEERALPFAWARPPLLRLRALWTADDEFTLVVTNYHGVIDGWSLHLFLEELLTRYDDPDAVVAPAQPYHRFVELERQARESEESLAFWRATLGGVAPLHLASGRGHDQAAVPHIDTLHVEPLPPGVGARLAEVADRHDVPVKSLLLAVHLRALGEATRRDEVVTGLVVSGRAGEHGDDRTIGLFLNTVPVRARLSTRSPADLAAGLWRAERDLMGHHVVPLPDIERAVHSGPLFDVFVNYTRFHRLGERPGGTRVLTNDLGGPVDVAFSLAVDFEVDAATGEPRLSLQYDGRRLSAHRIGALAARYRELVVATVDAPDAALPPVSTDTDPVARAAEVWRELTGVAPTDDTGFFQVGGTSLLALRLVSVLRDRHGIAVGLDEFNRDGTFGAIRRLALEGGAS